MFDGCMKPRRELCIFTLSGYNSLVDPKSGKEIKIRTGCKNTPARGSQFCTQCSKLILNNPALMKKFKGAGSKVLKDDVLIIEEVHNVFRNRPRSFD